MSIQELSRNIRTLYATEEVVILVSLYVRELWNVQTKCLLRKSSTTDPDFQREDKPVATATRAREWKTNSNVFRWGLGDRNRCIKNRVEIESLTHNIKLGWTLDPSEKKIAHQWTGTEGSTVCNSITSQTQKEHLYSQKIGQHSNCCISEQKGGGVGRLELLLQTIKQI